MCPLTRIENGSRIWRDFTERQMNKKPRLDANRWSRQPASSPSIQALCASCQRTRIPIGEDFDYSIADDGSATTTTLFPRQSNFQSKVFDRYATRRELEKLVVGETVFHLWGIVTYKDSRDIDRFTNFSFFIIMPRTRRGVPIWKVSDRHKATFALKAGVSFRRGRLIMVSPDSRQSSPLSGRKFTYRSVQICQASSLHPRRTASLVAELIALLLKLYDRLQKNCHLSTNPAPVRVGRHADTVASLDLGFLYSFVERPARTADLRSSRSDRRLSAVRTKLRWPVTQ
jgi:hypothetical protein